MSSANYSCIVFFKPEENKRPRKYIYINSIQTFAKFCRRIKAHYFNIYDRKTGNFINRYYLE